MSKFDALGSYLSKQKRPVMELSFSEIESILGFGLCQSAYKYPAYWRASKTHMLPNLIFDFGYSVENVDLVNQRVTLRKK